MQLRGFRSTQISTDIQADILLQQVLQVHGSFMDRCKIAECVHGDYIMFSHGCSAPSADQTRGRQTDLHPLTAVLVLSLFPR